MTDLGRSRTEVRDSLRRRRHRHRPLDKTVRRRNPRRFFWGVASKKYFLIIRRHVRLAGPSKRRRFSIWGWSRPA